MAVWLPFAIQGGEALLVWLATFFTLHAQGADWGTAATGATAAAGAKILPSQLLPGGKGPAR